LPANSLATRSVAGKARSYSYGLLAETMTKASPAIEPVSSPYRAGIEPVSNQERVI